jgi:hypothetical protein
LDWLWFISHDSGKDSIMFRLETDTHAPIILSTWLEVERHPLFLIATVFERLPFGWQAI